MQQSQQKMLSDFLGSWVNFPIEYDVKINNIVMDSRQVSNGDVFISLSQNNAVEQSNLYIDTAINAGAVAVIWDAGDTNAIPYAWSSDDRLIPLIAVNRLKENLARLINHFYHSPSKHLDIVAVTGTNGKTSCVNFIAQALENKSRCGLIGTLGIGIYPDISLSTHTTPDVLTVHKTLASFVEKSVSQAAIEVSSHGLAQGRIDEVDIDVAIFTNLTQDHLDYHGTMDAYLKEKVKLFQKPSLKMAIVNIDDRYATDVINAATVENIITYSIKNNTANIFANNIVYYVDKTEFKLNTQQGSISIQSKLIGDFNVSNILAVCAYLQYKAYSLKDIKIAIENIQSICGRMEKVIVDGQPLVVIDYAHTPDALEHALKTLQSQFKQNLTCVFGCGGERDQDKRKKMGRVADSFASRVILTSDNPRNESANEIAKQILSGITNVKKVTIELDRKKAIIQAINNTTEDGCVLVAGKGHETYQIIGTDKKDFNDTAVVKEFLSY